MEQENTNLDTTAPRLAVVVPCYNEEQALPLSMPRLLAVLDSLIEEGNVAADSYVLCVDDGSCDRTWVIIEELHKADKRVHGITLTHNRGHQFALLAGLMSVADSCDAAVSIDADMQDDPDAIKEMVAKFRAGAEIVYGVRSSRATDTWFKRNSARAFYRLQNSMGLQTVYDHADYRLMSRRALQILSQYKEQNLFLRGVVPMIGLDTAIVYYKRAERVAGESKYPLKKMLAFSVDGITSFSSRPLRWIFFIGMSLLAVDLIVAIYVLIAFFAGSAVSGWSSLMLSVWFLGSLILIAIGVVGEYIGKIFTEVKARPRFNIKDRI
ncbi:MAG: glycosyltransferase family 2 protein [Prevotella sp.]|nr:glycosyltransferase family 2 protein [Prevotella sp.]MCM1074408.1 glycosyltransferase family 2 protein [Ruminococcus sp.]